ncbi:hypothetical protein GCM10023185_40210 [Hymenobacter saemangeumensis]|uniref:Uncharacterized protein n=1 Tax=Hymenobacter saemangeumensis TaxID=1084522 RepID=A0ABP8IRG9_9BACT
MDLTFKEDQSRLRADHATLNANILRKTALYLLTQDPQPISLKRKRKQAAYDMSTYSRLPDIWCGSPIKYNVICNRSLDYIYIWPPF